VWAKRSVAGVFQPGDHGSTYSGTAIATAAVSAVIDEMHRIDAPRLARERGAELSAALRALPHVTEVRGAGLLLAMELDGVDAKTVYLAALERGLVTNAVNATALRLAPPLTVSSAEIAEAVAILRSVLEEVAS
jgi:acetylornithine/succinyldiaminopimelate/putrescine aminotransferase